MYTFLTALSSARPWAIILCSTAVVTCLAGSVQAGTQVGTAAAVNTDAFGTPPGAVRQVKLIGDNVVYNERIETSGSGLVQVLLNDGSTFTVGANSDLVIDEFVYDPNAGTGKLVASFGKGVVRFVGGKVSKKKGGVAVKTPVGTIGIRGGIANLNLEGRNPVFSLLFGEDLTFKGTDGKSQRIYQSGYSLQVDPVGLGSAVRRTIPADLSAVQTGLTAGAAQSGGTPNPPTGKQIAKSGVPNVNSNLGQVQTAPLPKPKAVQATHLLQAGHKLVQKHKTTVQRIIDRLAGDEDGIIDDIEDIGGGDTIDEVPDTSVSARILSAGTNFSPTWDSNRSVAAPSAQGLIGGSSGRDETVFFSLATVMSGNATGLYKPVATDELIYQFAFDGDGQYFYAQTYTDQDHVAQLGENSFIPVAPIVDPATDGNVSSYAWGAQYFHENFAVFAHLPNVMPGSATPFNLENMVIGLYGVGTNFASYGDGSGTPSVRNYDLAADPTLMFSMGTSGSGRTFTPLASSALFVNPLAAAELGTSFVEAIGSTGLQVIEDNATTLYGAHYLAGSFLIDGTGTDQKSLISLAAGDVGRDSGTNVVMMDTGRRGSHRISSGQGAALYTGPVGTIAGPDGGHFFGSNAQSFVFGNVLAGDALDDPYNDNYISLPNVFDNSGTVSASLHVGRLNGSSDVSALSRTDRTLNGYAAGVVESTVNFPSQVVGPVAFSSGGPSDLLVSFDSAQHSLGGTVTIRDTRGLDPEAASYTARFGFNADGSGAHRATFIDNDTYAARDASSLTETLLTTDGGQTLAQHPQQNPATYFVPNTLVETADDAIMAGTTECTCAFLEWGYWGTKMSYDDTNGVLANAAQREDAVHLGTWVAGDVTNSANLPTSGSASYAGHAAGNVINNGAQYLAAGDFTMSIDFARRTGSANIANFDGRTFGADLTEQPIAAGNQFSGVLAGGTTSGTVNTSIVAGPNSSYQGAIGNFNVTDGSWSATGIVAGEKQ